MAKFRKGKSGNPQGRPVGSGMSGQLRKAITDAAPEILQGLITAAKTGDTQAAKILIDKVLPNLKPQAAPVQITIGENLPASGNHVLTATMNGEIPPDVGSQLIRALSDQGRLVELEEMNRRLERIESQLEPRK